MTVYTFGYAGRRVSELRAHVDRLSGIVIDARFRPCSRGSAEWGRRALEAEFRDRYAWLQDFGNVNYKSGPIELRDYASGARRLTDLVSDGRAPILLCVCADPVACHRSQVATRLSDDFGWTIDHLR